MLLLLSPDRHTHMHTHLSVAKLGCAEQENIGLANAHEEKRLGLVRELCLEIRPHDAVPLRHTTHRFTTEVTAPCLRLTVGP
jgi:hypothetical protein